MVISKYLDSVEGTDQELMLLNGIVKLTEEEDIADLMKTPGVGAIFCALAALGNSESIAEFKRTEHYDVIKDWGITVFNLEKGYFSIHPGPKHMKIFFAVTAVVGAGMLLWKLRRKYK